MKAYVKQQYQEFVEHVEFPTLVYIYETGRIIAANSDAIDIIGLNCKNINLIWENQTRLKLKKEILNNGNDIIFNQSIYIGKQMIEVDMEINSFVIDKNHIIICFFEESYKQRFIDYLSTQVPRLYWKDKRLSFLGGSYYFKQDVNIDNALSYLVTEDLYEKETSESISEDEKELLASKECQYNIIQQFKDVNGKGFFAKLHRMPIINKNGTCMGMMGVYNMILNREAYKSLFDNTLQINNILNKVISRSDSLVVCWTNEEGWPVEYVSPNFRRYGYNINDFYTKKIFWKDIIHPDDCEKVYRESAGCNGLLAQEYRIRKTNGDVVWVKDEPVSVFKKNKLCYRECVIKDITVQKKLADEGDTVQINLSGNGTGNDFVTGQPSNLEKYLRKAINKNCAEFEVYYQPVVNCKDNTITGAEALLRWNSEELGMINPGDFIPLSEQLELIVPLGEFVLREAFAVCKQWNEKFRDNFSMNINLSVVQLIQPNIIGRIMDIVQKVGVNCSNIVFEVTENLAIKDIDLAKSVLMELRNCGFKIALDNFGTGFSSLNHIMEIPMDYIKMDKRFISIYGTKQFNPVLLSAITDLAHSMNVEVVVEGVETKAQMEFLMLSNTDKCQGFLYGHPIPEREFTANYNSIN